MLFVLVAVGAEPSPTDFPEDGRQMRARAYWIFRLMDVVAAVRFLFARLPRPPRFTAHVQSGAAALRHCSDVRTDVRAPGQI